MTETAENKEIQQVKEPPVISFDQKVGAMVPQNFAGLWKMAAIMASSGMMPKNMEKPETVFVVVQMGLEVGLPPMASVQNIANINNRPSIWGDAALGIVRASGKLEKIHEKFDGKYPEDGFKAICEVKRVGGEEVIREFSVEDAKIAGLWIRDDAILKAMGNDDRRKSMLTPWYKYPKRMLQMRARSWALRDEFSDVLKGLITREEAGDIVEMAPDAAGGYSMPETAAENLAKAIKDQPTTTDPLPDKPEPADAEKKESIREKMCLHEVKKLKDNSWKCIKCYKIFNEKPKDIPIFEDHSDADADKKELGPEVKTPKPEITGPMNRDEWVNLRSKGYPTYVFKHLEAIKAMPASKIFEMRDKWLGIEGIDAPWPLDPKPIDTTENGNGDDQDQASNQNGQNGLNGSLTDPTTPAGQYAAIVDNLRKEDPRIVQQAIRELGLDDYPDTIGGISQLEELVGYIKKSMKDEKW